jgi:anthranilate/para-aminobenzoate synthase component I
MVPAPSCDVFELYRRISRPGLPSFLLESGGTGSNTSRYSFFGDNPYALLTGSQQGAMFESSGGVSLLQGPAFDELFDRLDDSFIPARSGLPPFYGGAVGYLSYDWVRTIESLPTLAQDDLGLPLLQFAFVDLVAALDHAEHRLYLMYCPPRRGFGRSPVKSSIAKVAIVSRNLKRG